MLFSDKFLQSKEFDLIVPQIQFFRVWDIPVVEHSANTVQKTGDSPGAVLGMMSTCPLVCNDRVMVQTVRKTVSVPQVQFIDEGPSRCEHEAKVPAVFGAMV